MEKGKAKEFYSITTTEFMKVSHLIKEGNWESNLKHGIGF